MIPPSAPGSLLVIVPALNEEAAIGGVVREIHQHVPGVPVLVIDDCSSDNTRAVARQAGAEVLPMPHHLGLGGCVQAGYKLAFELGFHYVIRVDGDGQHCAGDNCWYLTRNNQRQCGGDRPDSFAEWHYRRGSACG